jgi:hypothetical protein
MRLMFYAMGVAGSAVFAGFKAAEAVDSALCRVPLYRQPRACVLDRLLGPAEDFEYNSTTTPSPPAVS